MTEQIPLLEQVPRTIRLKHYSIRTEEAYLHSIKRFILFHQKRHPREMVVAEIRQNPQVSFPLGD